MKIETKYNIGDIVYFAWGDHQVIYSGVINEILVKEDLSISYFIGFPYKRGFEMPETHLFKSKEEFLAQSTK